MTRTNRVETVELGDQDTDGRMNNMKGRAHVDWTELGRGEINSGQTLPHSSYTHRSNNA